MNSLRVFNRQAGFIVAIAALLLALVVPALAGAEQVTDRSVQLSSSSKSTDNVTYTVKFTPKADAGAFVVDFCKNSPIVTETCTAPDSPFSASAAASTTTNFTDVTGAASKFTVAGAMTAGTPVSVDVTGIHNPGTAVTIYARIVTYDTKANALTYTSTDLKTGSVDSGSVAIPITDSIGVSAAVMESMTFCVSGADITANCANAGSTAPSLTLGETTGTTKALTSTAVSTGDIYTQISTNAATGAVVNLKSNAAGCGGLINTSEPTGCYIKPAIASENGITPNHALFGLMVLPGTDPSDSGVVPDGQYVAAGSYNGTTYLLNYNNTTSGVTSVFGDPVLNTNNAPANNKNMKLRFGASVTNSTPAGKYTADLSLIATGKF